MRVSAKIFDGIAKAVKGFFYVRAPVFYIKVVFPLFPVVGILQIPAGGRKYQLSTLIIRVQAGQILALEFIPQDVDRDKNFCLDLRIL